MKSKIIKYYLHELQPEKFPIGKHNYIPDEEFNPNELKMGIKVEMEHTGDPEISKCIVKDHLSEIPDYYTRLKKMESEAGV